MRPLFLVLAGLCASTSTSLLVWAAISLETDVAAAPYCELLQDSLIRTNLPDWVVKTHVEDVLCEMASKDASAKRPLHELVSEVWFSEPDAWGTVQERASSNHYELSGVEGGDLEVRVIRNAEHGAMIFFNHDSPSVVRQVAHLLANRLQIEIAENG